MTFFEAVGYKFYRAKVKFKRWQVHPLIKLLIVLSAFALVAWLVYALIELVIMAVIFKLWISSRNVNGIPLFNNNHKKNEGGFRDGHSGYGYYTYDNWCIYNEEDEESNS